MGGSKGIGRGGWGRGYGEIYIQIKLRTIWGIVWKPNAVEVF